MKTKLGILAAPLIAVGALALPLLAASDKGEKQPTKWSQVEFRWQKVERDGSTRELPGRRKAKTVYKKADGTLGSREISAALRLKGGDFHVAMLPGELRRKPVFVEFMISGTAGATADQGSIINIDGAIIGFQQRPGGERADVMVLDIGPSGAPVWRKAGLGVSIDPMERITASPRVAVRLDHAHDEWSLYSKDVLVVSGLPLLAEKGAPRISLKAGLLDGDTLVLKKIQLRSNPSKRSKVFMTAGPRARGDAADRKPGN